MSEHKFESQKNGYERVTCKCGKYENKGLYWCFSCSRCHDCCICESDDTTGREWEHHIGHLHDDKEWYKTTCLWVAKQYINGDISRERARRTLGHFGVDPSNLDYWVEYVKTNS
jgi:hypothetical protein